MELHSAAPVTIRSEPAAPRPLGAIPYKVREALRDVEIFSGPLLCWSERQRFVKRGAHGGFTERFCVADPTSISVWRSAADWKERNYRKQKAVLHYRDASFFVPRFSSEPAGAGVYHPRAVRHHKGCAWLYFGFQTVAGPPLLLCTPSRVDYDAWAHFLARNTISRSAYLTTYPEDTRNVTTQCSFGAAAGGAAGVWSCDAAPGDRSPRATPTTMSPGPFRLQQQQQQQQQQQPHQRAPLSDTWLRGPGEFPERERQATLPKDAASAKADGSEAPADAELFDFFTRCDLESDEATARLDLERDHLDATWDLFALPSRQKSTPHPMAVDAAQKAEREREESGTASTRGGEALMLRAASDGRAGAAVFEPAEGGRGRGGGLAEKVAELSAALAAREKALGEARAREERLLRSVAEGASAEPAAAAAAEAARRPVLRWANGEQQSAAAMRSVVDSQAAENRRLREELEGYRSSAQAGLSAEVVRLSERNRFLEQTRGADANPHPGLLKELQRRLVKASDEAAEAEQFWEQRIAYADRTHTAVVDSLKGEIALLKRGGSGRSASPTPAAFAALQEEVGELRRAVKEGGGRRASARRRRGTLRSSSGGGSGSSDGSQSDAGPGPVRTGGAALLLDLKLYMKPGSLCSQFHTNLWSDGATLRQRSSSDDPLPLLADPARSRAPEYAVDAAGRPLKLYPVVNRTWRFVGGVPGESDLHRSDEHQVVLSLLVLPPIDDDTHVLRSARSPHTETSIRRRRISFSPTRRPAM
ncbi:hypothetical protein DIPPA_08896 [Diplonema papillatum]|nr:hypothetical protein DIPPA_08896 [Diplonema papillatum]